MIQLKAKDYKPAPTRPLLYHSLFVPGAGITFMNHYYTSQGDGSLTERENQNAHQNPLHHTLQQDPNLKGSPNNA